MFSLLVVDVSWKTTLQSIVALSTTEVEYQAISEACKEATWLRGLCGGLYDVDIHHEPLYYVAVKVICLAKGYLFHERTNTLMLSLH